MHEPLDFLAVNSKSFIKQLVMDPSYAISSFMLIKYHSYGVNKFLIPQFILIGLV